MYYKKSYIINRLMICCVIGMSTVMTQTFAQKPVQVFTKDGNLFTKEKLYGLSETRGAYEVILGDDGMPKDYVRVLQDDPTRKLSTAALGPKGGLDAGEPLSLWYDTWANETYTQEWRQLVSGTTVPITHKITWPFKKYRDGAEVNQLTGELYFSSDTATKFGNNQTKGGYASEYAAIAVWNPVTGDLAWNHKLIPIGENLRGWTIATDVAIDPEGNIFVLVRYGSRTKLVKVNVPRDNKGKAVSQNWTYSVVQDFNNVRGSDVYGMAFLNGLLYAAYSGNHLFVLNPLTGESKEATKPRPPYAFFDMASAQVAPVIRGRVYEDLKGLGNRNDFSDIANADQELEEDQIKLTGAPGVTVEIWRDGQLLGNVVTEADGTYNFLVDSTDATYSIVINNPTIIDPNEKYDASKDPTGKGPKQYPALLTWSSAISKDETANYTTAFCFGTKKGDAVNLVKKHETGKCLANLSPKSLINKNFLLALANKYKKKESDKAKELDVEVQVRTDVTMTTDRVIAVADFALHKRQDLVKERVSIMKLY